MNIFLPISLDRWSNPISSLLRECALYNRDYSFYALSSPENEYDVQQAESLWSHNHINKIDAKSFLFKNYDLVHTASYSHNNFMASLLIKAKSVGRTKILNTMNLEVLPEHTKDWIKFRRLDKIVDFYVGVSHSVENALASAGCSNVLSVIPNGFDHHFFDPEVVVDSGQISKEHSLPCDYVFTAAKFELRKRPDIVLTLARMNPDVNFVWAGHADPECLSLYSKELQELPNFFYIGSVSRPYLRFLIHQCQLFVFPSDREGLPLAVIESLGMGKRVLGQPVSSMPELITSPTHGSLISGNSLEEWSSYIHNQIKSCTTVSARYCASLRADSIEKYSWESVAGRYTQIYNKIYNY